jgi:hypothetical protein
LGLVEATARGSFEAILREEMAELNRMFGDGTGPSTPGTKIAERILDYLEELDYERWKSDLRDAIEQGSEAYSGRRKYRHPLYSFGNLEHPLLIRVLTEMYGDSVTVSLSLPRDQDIAQVSRGKHDLLNVRQPAAATWLALPSRVPIVITEGSFDAYVLQTAIRVLKPGLAGFLRFLDYDGGVEGSASAAVRTLKSFAAAGVNNRVLLILDNDSAGHEAAMALAGFNLPPQYAAMHYPDLPMAENYPTLGPQGNNVMNVNGLAGSIELYFGEEVLAHDNGSLTPIQWTGYMGKIRRYQGEVLNKRALQLRYKEKIKTALQDPAAEGQHDWSALKLILDEVLSILRTL